MVGSGDFQCQELDPLPKLKRLLCWVGGALEVTLGNCEE
jgi:hypothetical protein